MCTHVKDTNGQIVSDGCGVPAKHPLLEGPPPLLTFHYEENILDENQSFYANFNLNHQNNIQPTTAELTTTVLQCCDLGWNLAHYEWAIGPSPYTICYQRAAACLL